MKKNISLKLTAIFLSAVVLAFVIFSLVMSSLIQKYAISAKDDKKIMAVDSVIENISLYVSITEDLNFGDEFTQFFSQVTDSISRIAEKCNSDIYVINSSGKIVMSSIPEMNGKTMISSDQFLSISQPEVSSQINDMFNFFENPKSIRAFVSSFQSFLTLTNKSSITFF